MVRPLFVFSLPRSGSTLLQRVLATSPQIATTSEPWFLLPLMYSLKRRGVYAEYGQHLLTNAVEDFCDELPQGKGDYLEEIGNFAQSLYSKAAPGLCDYFLDKTPRYHLVADEILMSMPDCKAVFLWRNPLAVVASIIETFGKGEWVLYAYELDLYRGLDNLVNAYKAHAGRGVAVKYEDLIISPEKTCRLLSNYLDIEYSSEMIESFAKTKLDGRYGDPTGTKLYDALSQKPLEKWKNTLATPLRKAWCRQYLNRIGEDRLAIMGYDLHELIIELDNIPVRPHKMISDSVRSLYGIYYRLITTVAGNRVQHLLGRRKSS